MRAPRTVATLVKGPEVVTPIADVVGVSTNGTAQGCLEAIEVLEMCGERMR